MQTGDFDGLARSMRNRFTFGFYLLLKLPAAFFSGVRIAVIEPQRCETTVPFKWFSQNPFRSTYFACLSMAAELSTGALALGHIHKIKPAVSMLVVKIEGEFHKKAIGTTRFICTDGQVLQEAISQAIQTKQAQQVQAISRGYNESGELVAAFTFTWSFRQKK